MKTTSKPNAVGSKKSLSKKAPANPYEMKMRSFIDETDKKLKEFKSKGSEVSDEVKEKYDAQIHAISLKKDELKQKLQHITSKTGERIHDVQEDVHDAFEDVKEEMDEAYHGIKEGFKYLFSKISK